MAHVLVIGSGAREHAIVSRLNKSPHVSKITVCPGNAGTQALDAVQNRALDVKNHEEVAKACSEWGVSLVVVGPEDPLADGIADTLSKHNIKVFGPSKNAALLESSKAWSKEFMKRHGIPTADFHVFNGIDDASDYIKKCPWVRGCAIKASGLAGGKGVIVAGDLVEAEQALASIKATEAPKMRKAFDTIVIEEKLEGFEVSVLAFCDGSNVHVMPPCQDHKQRFCGGLGPNTGGMGAYGPCPLVSEEDMALISKDVIQKTVDKMRDEGNPYVGVLYAGIMMTENGPKVLEFNCRFGDPETQVLMMLLQADLFSIMMACAEGKLNTVESAFSSADFAVTVNVVIANYPGDVSKGTGFKILGLDEVCSGDCRDESLDTEVFYAGVKLSPSGSPDEVVTSGGRVVSVSCRGPCLEAIVSKALWKASKITFKDAPVGFEADFRRDIAFQAIKWNREKQQRLLSYKSAGVSIDAGNEFVKNIRCFTAGTRTAGVLSGLGLFGALFDPSLVGYKDPVLVSGTDGVGTKLKIAIDMNYHKTVGEDLVAMCVNDILVHGAEPMFFLDYLACGKLDPHSKQDVVEGIANGCLKAGCALVGGETAEMPGMYRGSDYDLAGFVVGACDRSTKIPDMDKMKPGNAIIGIASSGLHSNGFSLVRKVIQVSNLSLDQPAPFNPDRKLGHELLKPTFIYTPLLKVLRRPDVHGASHITGGGIEENLGRVLPPGLMAHIGGKWKMPSVFAWLSALGVSAEEMLRTFNLGLGLILVVDEHSCDEILAEIRKVFANSFDLHDINQSPHYLANDNPGEVAFCWKIGELRSRNPSDPPCTIPHLHSSLVEAGAILAHTRPEAICLGSRKRVAVLISGSGTNLQALLDHTLSGPSAAQIVLVISNVAGVEGLKRAEKVGVQTQVISHKDYGSRDEFDQALHRTLSQRNVDLVFLAGFMRILTGKFVRQWLGRMVNVHPSLLPSFKGKDAQKQALDAGVCVSGCSVHFVVEEVDAGAIIAQESVPVMATDTVSSLTDRIKRAEHRIFPRAMELVARNKVFLNSGGKVERTSDIV